MNITETILKSTKIKLETEIKLCNSYKSTSAGIRDDVVLFTERSEVIKCEVLGLLGQAHNYGLLTYEEVEDASYRLGVLLSDKYVEFLKVIRGL